MSNPIREKTCTIHINFFYLNNIKISTTYAIQVPFPNCAIGYDGKDTDSRRYMEVSETPDISAPEVCTNHRVHYFHLLYFPSGMGVESCDATIDSYCLQLARHKDHKCNSSGKQFSFLVLP